MKFLMFPSEIFHHALMSLQITLIESDHFLCVRDVCCRLLVWHCWQLVFILPSLARVLLHDMSKTDSANRL